MKHKERGMPVGDLSSTISQLDLTDIYRKLHLAKGEYTFFSRSHGGITKTDHILGHKTHLSEFKRIEIIQSMFSDTNEMKLEISNNKITGKSQIIWKSDNTLLNNTWVEEISREF